MRKKSIYLSIIFLLYLSIGYSNYQRVVRNYSFISDKRDSLLVRFLINEINEAKGLFQYYFGDSLKQQVSIILPSSDIEYDRLLRGIVPEWSGGVAIHKEGRIILKPGEYFDAQQYREVVLHELTHLYLAEFIGEDRLPLWINEGLAMYLSSRSISWQENIFIGNSITSGNVLQLAEIDSLLIFGFIKAKLAYLEALLAIQYIIDSHGKEVLINLIHAFRDNKSTNQIFFEHLGYDYYDFENKFYLHLKNNYRWMVFLQFDRLIWLSFILILIVAFIARKFHNRRIAQNWDQEDMV